MLRKSVSSCASEANSVCSIIDGELENLSFTTRKFRNHLKVADLPSA